MNVYGASSRGVLPRVDRGPTIMLFCRGNVEIAIDLRTTRIVTRVNGIIASSNYFPGMRGHRPEDVARELARRAFVANNLEVTRAEFWENPIDNPNESRQLRDEAQPDVKAEETPEIKRERNDDDDDKSGGGGIGGAGIASSAAAA